MKPKEAEMRQSLLDVRKAYRLLHDYQRMSIDAAHYIGTQLGYDWNGGWPRLSNPPPRAGYGNRGNWAWDWVNMILYEFHFLKTVNEQTYSLSLIMISDSGIFAQAQKGEPKTSQFAPVAESETLLAVLWSRGTWKELPFLKNDYALARDFVRVGGTMPENHREMGEIIHGRCFDYSALMTQESADALIDDLIFRTKNSEQPFERSVKKVG